MRLQVNKSDPLISRKHTHTQKTPQHLQVQNLEMKLAWQVLASQHQLPWPAWACSGVPCVPSSITVGLHQV
jgi:hypothetical protein